MNNYSRNVLNKLKSDADSLSDSLSKSIDWTQSNLHYEERQSLLRSLKEMRSEVFTITESVDSRPVFALFGQSQVGKSYLVKNLLSTNGRGFEIEFPTGNVDFLNAINPVGGGAESTGVVTRFTIASNATDRNFPIQLSLLDVKDILLILCDSFFSDLQKIDGYPDSEGFSEHAIKCKQDFPSKDFTQHYLSENHVFIIKRYFDQHFMRHSHYVDSISRSDYWLIISSYIEHVRPQDWVKLFEILWCYNPIISKLFSKLISGLTSLRFSRTAFAGVDIVLRDKGKILDVERVKGIFGVEVLAQVVPESHPPVQIDLHLLSALTAEITLPLNPSITSEKEFLLNTDLLDFPGARSRQQLNASHISEESAPMMLLRGKISYLFNKYSANYEINNLLFCLKNAQNEVSDIPQLLNDWIERNIGGDAQERERRLAPSGRSPLFIVFTFYNESLKFNSNSDQGDLSAKWNNRFIRFFKDETVTTKYNWDDHWTESSPDFKSFYFLRDFEFSDDVFNGFRTEGRETGIKSERQDYMERMKGSFLDFPYVRAHFQKPEETWQETSTPGRDGSELIIRNLLPTANNITKTNNYLAKLAGFQMNAATLLRKHYQTDDTHAQRKKAFEEGSAISAQLLRLFNTNGSMFGDFLSKLYISNTKAYNYIHENYLPASKNHTPSKEEVFLRTYGLDLNATIAENKNILLDRLYLESIEHVDVWLTDNDIDLTVVLQNVHITAASKLVDGVITIWKSGLDPQNFKEFQNKGLEVNTIRLINENLLRTFDLFEVRKDLIRIFEKKTRLMRVSNDTDEYLASIISSYINDFVSNFGFNFMSDERKIQVISLASDFRIDTSYVSGNRVHPNESEIKHVFDEDDSSNNLVITYPVVEHYQTFLCKVRLILLSNCGFRNFNIAENDRLKEIFTSIETLQFSAEQ
jgi:hypothetical protein